MDGLVPDLIKLFLSNIREDTLCEIRLLKIFKRFLLRNKKKRLSLQDFRMRRVPAVLAICAFAGIVTGCPFAGLGNNAGDLNDCLLHHSKEMCEQLRLIKGESRSTARTLLGAPGYPPLPAPDISGKNNAINSPALLSSLVDGHDLIDIVSAFAGGLLEKQPPAGTLGKDMCIWNFQSLPPPPGPDAQYKIPAGDAVRVIELCNQANDKFQSLVGDDKHDGVAVFGGCTIGSRAAKEICDWHLDSTEDARYCNEPAQTTSVSWPQAVTMFRIRPAKSLAGGENAELKSFMQEWRSNFHKNHIRWVMEGGTGSPTGSVVGGWGAGSGPGMSRKIVPCDAIDPKFLYPKPFPPAALNAEGTRTIMDEAYEHWQSLCSVLPWTNPSDCEFAYKDAPKTGSSPDVAASSPAEVPPAAAASGASTPESCSDYREASLGCARKVTAFGFNGEREAMDAEEQELLWACAKKMCDAWPGGGDVTKNAEGSWECDVKTKPTDCTNGATYMALRSARESCQTSAFLDYSEKRLAVTRAHQVNPGDVAAEAAAACEKVVRCERDTVAIWASPEGKRRSCTGFFDYIKVDFPWSTQCDQAKICDDYSATPNPPAAAPAASLPPPAAPAPAAPAAPASAPAAPVSAPASPKPFKGVMPPSPTTGNHSGPLAPDALPRPVGFAAEADSSADADAPPDSVASVSRSAARRGQWNLPRAFLGAERGRVIELEQVAGGASAAAPAQAGGRMAGLLAFNVVAVAAVMLLLVVRRRRSGFPSDASLLRADGGRGLPTRRADYGSGL